MSETTPIYDHGGDKPNIGKCPTCGGRVKTETTKADKTIWRGSVGASVFVGDDIVTYRTIGLDALERAVSEASVEAIAAEERLDRATYMSPATMRRYNEAAIRQDWLTERTSAADAFTLATQVWRQAVANLRAARRAES